GQPVLPVPQRQHFLLDFRGDARRSRRVTGRHERLSRRLRGRAPPALATRRLALALVDSRVDPLPAPTPSRQTPPSHAPAFWATDPLRRAGRRGGMEPLAAAGAAPAAGATRVHGPGVPAYVRPRKPRRSGARSRRTPCR